MWRAERTGLSRLSAAGRFKAHSDLFEMKLPFVGKQGAIPVHPTLATAELQSIVPSRLRC